MLSAHVGVAPGSAVSVDHLPPFRAVVSVAVVDLPVLLVERIIASVQAGLPDNVTLHQIHSRSIRIERRSAVGAPSGRLAAPVRWTSQIGVRNRDGIRPQSIAWAMWMLLDSCVQMARATGAPWQKDIARGMRAYAQSEVGQIHGWITVDAASDLRFAPVSLDGVQMMPPSGRRLPFPLSKRHRLPNEGPISSPWNRSEGR